MILIGEDESKSVDEREKAPLVTLIRIKQQLKENGWMEIKILIFYIGFILERF